MTVDMGPVDALIAELLLSVASLVVAEAVAAVEARNASRTGGSQRGFDSRFVAGAFGRWLCPLCSG